MQTITAQEREAISNRHVSISVQKAIDRTRVYLVLGILVLVILMVLYVLRNIAERKRADVDLRNAAIAFDCLLRLGDRAMYQAKASGGNRVVLYAAGDVLA